MAAAEKAVVASAEAGLDPEGYLEEAEKVVAAQEAVDLDLEV